MLHEEVLSRIAASLHPPICLLFYFKQCEAPTTKCLGWVQLSTRRNKSSVVIFKGVRSIEQNVGWIHRLLIARYRNLAAAIFLLKQNHFKLSSSRRKRKAEAKLKHKGTKLIQQSETFIVLVSLRYVFLVPGMWNLVNVHPAYSPNSLSKATTETRFTKGRTTRRTQGGPLVLLFLKRAAEE